MHYWGDDWPYWDNLYSAEQYIWKYVKRYTRCTLVSKEKYGTIRYEYVFPPGASVRFGLYIKLPWIKKKYIVGHKVIKVPYILWSWQTSWLYNKWASWGWKMTYKAVKEAIKKWPHLEHELLEDLASNEEVVGKEIHDKYWRTL